MLADASGSMEGVKISMLNNALREMIATLAGMDDVRGSFQIAVISFGNEVVLHQPLVNVKDAYFQELVAKGKTPLGEAIHMVADMLEDRLLIPSTSYAPTIVLISDGMPTDLDADPKTFDYLTWAPMKRLHSESPRASKCLRLAMGVGNDADRDMLRAFINNSDVPVFASDEASGIERFFRRVTMSTVSRMSVVNSNNASLFFPGEDEPEDLLT